MHINTIKRWVFPGLCGVRLETKGYGGRLFSSVAAVERFSMAVREAKQRRCKGGRKPAPAIGAVRLEQRPNSNPLEDSRRRR